MRTFAVSVLLAVAACTPAGQPNGALAIDVSEYRAAFAAQFPEASGARLSVQFKGDFDFYFDGRADFRSSTSSSGLVTNSSIENFAGNQVCIAASGGWSGACIDIFETPAEGLYCEGRFGNGVSWQESCAFSPL